MFFIGGQESSPLAATGHTRKTLPASIKSTDATNKLSICGIKCNK